MAKPDVSVGTLPADFAHWDELLRRKFASFVFAETERTAHPGFDRPTTLTMRKALA